MNTQSEDQNELFAALAKAQGEMESPKKTAENPYFKSSYAPLSECIRVSRGPLSKHGLAVIQEPTLDSEGNVTIRTTLAHESGQWRCCELTMSPDKSGPQAMGVVITYARRYGYSAMVGLAQEDDDGNDAGPPKEAKPEAFPVAKIKQLKADWWGPRRAKHEKDSPEQRAAMFGEWFQTATGVDFNEKAWTDETYDACLEQLATEHEARQAQEALTADEAAAAAASETVSEQTPCVEDYVALFATCQSEDACLALADRLSKEHPEDDLAIMHASKGRIKGFSK